MSKQIPPVEMVLVKIPKREGPNPLEGWTIEETEIIDDTDHDALMDRLIEIFHEDVYDDAMKVLEPAQQNKNNT